MMRQHSILQKYLRWLFYCLLIFVSHAFASNPTELFREWSKIDVTGPYNSDWSDLRYEAFFESRNQETRLDFATGYRFTPLISAWSGFTWISPNNGNPQIYRPWQQLIWELFDKNPIILFQTRTRLEELKQEGQPVWLLRVRERWRIAFPEKLPHKLTPVIYDEVFFNINQPSWVSTKIIDQNRFFVGIDTPPLKKTFIEIGYINQYIFTVPINHMAHILSVSLMIELS